MASSTTSVLALLTAGASLVTAVVNGLVALNASRQGAETRDAVEKSTESNDAVLSGLAVFDGPDPDVHDARRIARLGQPALSLKWT